jgi:metal-responsive CopG/Arc/MetJ family transcriptional regulator
MAMDSNEKQKTVKIGLEITIDLDVQINEAFKKYGYKDRAEFIRNAIRRELERVEKLKK